MTTDSLVFQWALIFSGALVALHVALHARDEIRRAFNHAVLCWRRDKRQFRRLLVILCLIGAAAPSIGHVAFYVFELWQDLGDLVLTS